MLDPVFKESFLRGVISGTIIGAFLFIGLGLFAGRVFYEHEEQQKRITLIREDLSRVTSEINTNLSLLRAEQAQLSARLIEMRYKCLK